MYDTTDRNKVGLVSNLVENISMCHTYHIGMGCWEQQASKLFGLGQVRGESCILYVHAMYVGRYL